MRRIFWLGVGATIGVLVVRKISKTAEAFTPTGLAASFGGVGEALRDFVDDVRAAMDEHEHELLEALGVDSVLDSDATAGGRHAGASSPSGEPPPTPPTSRRH